MAVSAYSATEDTDPSASDLPMKRELLLTLMLTERRDDDDDDLFCCCPFFRPEGPFDVFAASCAGFYSNYSLKKSLLLVAGRPLLVIVPFGA